MDIAFKRIDRFRHGRLPNDLIERIKREVSLVRLLEGQGYAPVRQDKDWAVGCPFHEGDDTPSLIVTPEPWGNHQP